MNADFHNLFISPHAMEQFQQRIAPMDADKARWMILAGIPQSTDVRVLPDGVTRRMRTRRPFAFRAYCTFDVECRPTDEVGCGLKRDDCTRRQQRYVQVQAQGCS